MTTQREYRVEAPDAVIANERAKAIARSEGWRVRTTARIVPASLTSGGNGWYIVTLAVADQTAEARA